MKEVRDLLRRKMWQGMTPLRPGAPGRLAPHLCVLLLGSFFLACEPGGQEGPSTAQGGEEARTGRLVIVGGALQRSNVPVYQAVLDGRAGTGPICVLPTASVDPEDSMESYVTAFDSLAGAGTALGVLLSVENPEDAASPQVVQALEGCSGFFFTGGSQSRIVEVFLPGGEPSPAYQAVWERFQEGAVVSGSSAGAGMMSDPMIAGGSSLASLATGVRTQSDGDGVWLTRGMGYFPHGPVDQHFLARGRWARLMVALLHGQVGRLGFGIDENTALVVDGDTARVVGASGVVVMDVEGAEVEEGGFGGRGVRVHLLGAGDGVELRTGRILWDPSKPPLPAGETPLEMTEADLFERWVLLEALHAFGVSSDTQAAFAEGEYAVELEKGQGFRAVGWEEAGVRDLPRGLSLGPFSLGVRGR